MKPDYERNHWFTCVCGKKGYVSRRAARKAKKQVHPNEHQFAAYRCPRTGCWHLGHFTPRIRAKFRRSA